MQNQQLIDFLEGQKAKFEQSDFNLDAWKSSTITFLDQILGSDNDYSQLIDNLQYEERLSVEELYPKKVIDHERSNTKFRDTLDNLIEQIKLLGEDISISADRDGERTLQAVVSALKNNLTGRQLAELKKASTGSKKNEKITELFRAWDLESTLNILADILETKEIWKKL